MFTKIMWATDRSPTTERVLPLAKELAAGSGAKLIITHIEKITTVAPGNPSSWTASRRWTPTCATWWTSWSAKGSMQNSWKRRSVKAARLTSWWSSLGTPEPTSSCSVATARAHSPVSSWAASRSISSRSRRARPGRAVDASRRVTSAVPAPGNRPRSDLPSSMGATAGSTGAGWPGGTRCGGAARGRWHRRRGRGCRGCAGRG